jgi:cytochrome c biogenesis protein CcdA
VGAVPVSVALAAGGLAVINPCAFPLLPAFLSFYIGADEDQLPRAPTRVFQGVIVGGLVTVGFLGLFALIALPVSFGAGLVARSIPWVGLATGVLLALVGLVALLGGHLRLPVGPGLRSPDSDRRITAIFMFGVGYGMASLGCTLPIFLTLVATSLGGGKLAVFAAYGAGMAIVLTSLAVAVALLREGIARSLQPLLPYMGRIAGALLLISGGYLAYYWGRIEFGDTATLANDPVVGFVTRYAAEIQQDATAHSHALLGVAAGFLVAAVLASLWQWRRRIATGSLVER